MASDDAIEWLAGLEAEATPGPWGDGEDYTEHGTSYWPTGPDGVYLMAGNHGESQEGADARLIATLRTVAPELLAVVRAVEEATHSYSMDDCEDEICDALDALRARLDEVRRG